MINNVVLTGRVTKDIELKVTPTGKSVCSFSLAVNRKFVQDGERQADFINCQLWGKSAETLEKYGKKGMLIGVEGRLQTRNYINQQGQTVYVTEVVAESFTFLEKKQSNDQPQFNDFETYGGFEVNDDDLPF
ncbi:single-stranded DNA-binding protein [uncultured Granulicatella sp.]|uniref:single-stranded DNA-binding protein n=1 Tax=uncultured Granulicatella sp. TaxID=316089 RepID=UPI0028E7CAE6|nr:single-stranded DNA-binding protein [uncultured Granulicatella sp.]